MNTTAARRSAAPVAAASIIGASTLGALAGWLLVDRLSPGGPALVVLGLVAALLVPTARRLSGRIVIAFAALNAVVFLAWLLPLAVPREALVGAMIGAAFVGSTAHALGTGRLGSVLPRVTVPDVVAIGGVGVLAPWTLWPYLSPASDVVAATIWMRQWDASSHAHIVWAMQRSHALLMGGGLGPDGSPLAMESYPAQYHAVAATLLDVWAGPYNPDPVVHIRLFLTAIALLAGLAAVVAACCVAALPAAERHPVAASVGAAAAGAALLVGPGAIALLDAHTNFHYALALVLATMAVALQAGRVWSPATLVVIVGGVVAASGAWLPLAIVAAFGALALALPLDRARWRAPLPAMIVCLAILAAGIALAVQQALWATGGAAGGAVNANGGIGRIPGFLITASLVGLALVLLVCLRQPRALAAEDAGASRAAPPELLGRLAVQATAIALLTLGGLGLGAYQDATLGGVKYYAIKLTNAGVMLALCFAGTALLVVVDAFVAPRTGGGWRRRLSHTGTALLTGVLALFAWGTPYATPLLWPTVPENVGSTIATIAPRPGALTALQEAEGVPADVRVLPITTNDAGRDLVDAVMVAASRGTYTNDTNAWVNQMFGPHDAITLAKKAAPDVRAGRVVIVTTPAMARAIEKAIPHAPQGAIRY